MAPLEPWGTKKLRVMEGGMGYNISIIFLIPKAN